MKSPESKSIEFDPEKLVQQFQVGIWRYLRAIGCDDALAEDLTQETFLKVLQKPFKVYGDAATASYLRRVAHNLFISHQRRAGKVVAVKDLQAFENAWTDWVASNKAADNGDELIALLQGCLGELNDRTRWALEMRFRDKLTRTAIAGNLRISEHGAKNLMQRGKKQLRHCIERKLNGVGK